ncbi:hypothetical protein B296_00017613, partial [Ensete ventricosum]
SVGGPEALGRSSARRSEPLAVVAGGGVPPVPALSRSIIRHFLVISVRFFLCSGFAYGCRIRVQLSKKVVNIGELRRLASQGIPDGTGIRSIVWKVLVSIESMFLSRS